MFHFYQIHESIEWVQVEGRKKWSEERHATERKRAN